MDASAAATDSTPSPSSPRTRIISVSLILIELKSVGTAWWPRPTLVRVVNTDRLSQPSTGSSYSYRVSSSFSVDHVSWGDAKCTSR